MIYNKLFKSVPYIILHEDNLHQVVQAIHRGPHHHVHLVGDHTEVQFVQLLQDL